eukprot:gnl/TRDRNA2_/TRDRNA2_176169_c6_seq2.p1 gnl/TRDRNA2_/TRDRNA2_176169_c6~~gnl/TRDRNA2_/TRDRNA2_176169_c6_seq2.p1  ORF type:complete len:191 (+),score=23.12 gnl/TRDRNA2_/TRDRNA2_176169_c6_seq2:57-629(+)
MAHFRTPSRFSAFRAALVVCTFTDPVAAIRFATVSFGQEKANAAHLVAEDDLEVSPQADDAAELHETDEQLPPAPPSPVLLDDKLFEPPESPGKPLRTAKKKVVLGNDILRQIIGFWKIVLDKCFSILMFGSSVYANVCEQGGCPSGQFEKEVFEEGVPYCYTKCDPKVGVLGKGSKQKWRLRLDRWFSG